MMDGKRDKVEGQEGVKDVWWIKEGVRENKW